MTTAMPELTFRLTPASAEHLRALLDTTGALVVGRHLFDITNGWGGRHPMDVPVVVAHPQRPGGLAARGRAVRVRHRGRIEAAVAGAAEIAGDKDVGVNGGQMARQALEAGLLDEIWVDLGPVLLGGGTPFFDQARRARRTRSTGPVSVVEGNGVTHLRYRVPSE